MVASVVTTTTPASEVVSTTDPAIVTTSEPPGPDGSESPPGPATTGGVGIASLDAVEPQVTPTTVLTTGAAVLAGQHVGAQNPGFGTNTCPANSTDFVGTWGWHFVFQGSTTGFVTLTATFDAPPHDDVSATFVDSDPSDNLTISGYAVGSGGDPEAFVAHPDDKHAYVYTPASGYQLLSASATTQGSGTLDATFNLSHVCTGTTTTTTPGSTATTGPATTTTLEVTATTLGATVTTLGGSTTTTAPSTTTSGPTSTTILVLPTGVERTTTTTGSPAITVGGEQATRGPGRPTPGGSSGLAFTGTGRLAAALFVGGVLLVAGGAALLGLGRRGGGLGGG